MWLSGVAFAESAAKGVGCAPICLFGVADWELVPVSMSAITFGGGFASPTTVADEVDPPALSLSVLVLGLVTAVFATLSETSDSALDDSSEESSLELLSDDSLSEPELDGVLVSELTCSFLAFFGCDMPLSDVESGSELLDCEED